MHARNQLLSLSLACCLVTVATAQAAEPLDLTSAVVVTVGELSAREQAAVALLVDEVANRTGVRWQTSAEWPAAGKSAIAVGNAATFAKSGDAAAKKLASEKLPAAEGYVLASGSALAGADKSKPAARAYVMGVDERGVLFGVGGLLRAMTLGDKHVGVADGLAINTAPEYPLRGHQLGYRPKTNSYDAWDLPVWDQYIRDLAVFGSNAIEIVPPRTDDAATSPHFPRPQLEMMGGMSQIADRYGVDVWIWYPALDRGYDKPEVVEFALKEWAAVFAKVPRIDAVFVPGGDPGKTQPKYLMKLLEKETEVLHKTHPKAQMWVSPQGFNVAWMDEFLEILRNEKPKWLTGVVFGPQVRLSLPDFRKAVPEQYLVRHYPDITHSRQCQYPVPDWDVAYAVTEARECINPRPTGQATIFRLLQPYTMGFLTYSEGCNDDVNKFVWSGLGWNSKQPVIDILREYSGYFIGPEYRDDFAQGLMGLERDWQGPVATNAGIEVTLQQFQQMERRAKPATLANWRFQSALYRACYDAYIRQRVLHDTEVEDRALDRLREAQKLGPKVAMDQAEAILKAGAEARPATDLHARIVELADALYQSIRMQTSVKKYQAIAVDRGATLDTVDYPLNDRAWLTARMAEIRKLPETDKQLAAIGQLVNWTDPGPGGFYDDLGNVARQPHLVVGPGFEKDPAFLESSHAGFEEWLAEDEPGEAPPGALRMSWIDHAESMLEAPLRMRYTDLDPTAQYRVKIVYAGDAPQKQIRLMANDTIEIHPLITKPWPVAPIEFDIPRQATAGGELNLSWYRQPGLGDNGRGCQVSEIWLMKK